jgi:hypothetical protein
MSTAAPDDQLCLRAVDRRLDQLDTEPPCERVDPQMLGRLHAKFL